MKYTIIISLLLSSIACSIYGTEMSNAIYGIILSGGIGQRLYPFSRKHKPKQFIDFSDNKSLLEITRDRIKELVTPTCLWAVTTSAQEQLVRSVAGSTLNHIVTEPLSRNTGPALLLTAISVYKQNPEAILFFVPADHHIPDQDLFAHTMRKALHYAAKSDDIVLLGIQPRHAASEYGYIEYGSLKDDSVHTVTRFHEKPSTDIAQKYLKAGNMLWNSGIFCAKAKVFLQQAQQYAPQLLKDITAYTQGTLGYDKLPDIPFDKAILERTAHCAVVPAHFEWSDVGSLEQFLTISRQIKKSHTTSLSLGSAEHLIDGSKKFVIVDMIDIPIIVVEMDDVIFITRRDQNQPERSKEVIKQLIKTGKEQYT